MARYDYQSLSPQDFEELVRDLLQAEWKVALEAFKSGRDQGIDLRYARKGRTNTIVQCKHYARSSVAKLLRDLRDSELPKIERLKPTRYVVVTSLPLSPADKDKIAVALQPFVRNTSDVLGEDDLEGLLSRHPGVERANFKLWLTSTGVLERVLHNAEHSHTQFEVERIRKKLPLFVHNKALPRAQQMLEEQRVVVISGVPGIGKTTLAEMLLYAHLEDGYEPVVLQTEVGEGRKLFSANRKQIFYYDDFLGQTFLGDQRSYLGLNHDAALIRFIEMIRQTPDSKFVLTTREHILRRAFQVSEQFQYSAVLSHRCVLELADYTFGQRARILYNHLYFSALSPAYKEAVLADDFFLDVIKHEHFNPRLIEWMTSLTRLNRPSPRQYRTRVIELLQSPEQLWSHAFSNQISDASRDLLLTIYSLGEWMRVDELEPAFDAIHRGCAVRYNRTWTPGDFRAALQELDGAFLTYRFNCAEFLNPSIRDFVAGVVCRSPAICFDLVVHSIRFSQVINLWDLAVERKDQPLFAAISANSRTLLEAAERLAYGESMNWQRSADGYVGRSIDTNESIRLAKLAEIANTLANQQFLALASRYSQYIGDRWTQLRIGFIPIVKALETLGGLEWFFRNGGHTIYRNVLDTVLDNSSMAQAYDWKALLAYPAVAAEWLPHDERRLQDGLRHYISEGVDNERDDCSSIDDLSGMRQSLSELSEGFGVNLAQQILSIERAIAARTEDESEEEDVEPEREPGELKAQLGRQIETAVTEDEVREMFKTLAHG